MVGASPWEGWAGWAGWLVQSLLVAGAAWAGAHWARRSASADAVRRLEAAPVDDGPGLAAPMQAPAALASTAMAASPDAPPAPSPAPSPAPQPAHAERAPASAADAEAHQAFAYTISHDLRAPLRVVEGFARFLKEDHGDALGRIGNDHLERILGASSRMHQMIDALLALSQLSTRPLERRPIDLSAMAGEVLADLRATDPQRQVVAIVQPGLVATGDPTLVRMVLDNLIGNAWKYSAKADPATIGFGREETAQGPAFCVRDNGAGFDMQLAGRLFGAFQRLHSAAEFPGHGVGLASVQRIVRRHGGQVWAQSAPGEGARFYFTLG